MLRIFTTFFLLATMFFSFIARAQQVGYENKPFYLIAHMINSSVLLDWAIAEGANAIEADLNFKGSNPVRFLHGGVCDCTYMDPDVCKQIRAKLNKTRLSDLCDVQEPADAYLKILATKNNVALFIVDSKVGTITTNKKQFLVFSDQNALKETYRTAGANVVAMLEQNLFAVGYKGKVIIGAPKTEYKEYIRGAVEAAKKSPYENKIYFSFDQMGSEVENVVQTLSSMTTKGVYGVGLTPGAQFTPFHDNYEKGVNNAGDYVNSGIIKMTYIWGQDTEGGMRQFIRATANGIMTNRPSTLKKVVSEEKLRLATPEDPL